MDTTPEPGVVKTRLRITRRGRVVLGSLVSLPFIALAVALMLNGGVATATTETGNHAVDYVTVKTGGSLWSLVREVAPLVDPRDAIELFVMVNHLPSAAVRAGQRLAIPAQYAHAR